MKTRNLILIVFFGLVCLILSRCEEIEFELKPKEDKTGADTTNVDTTKVDSTKIDTTAVDTVTVDTIKVDTLETRLVIDGPSNDTIVFAGDSVVLHWHIENAKDSVTYNSIVDYYIPGTEYIKIDVGEDTEYMLHIPYPQTKPLSGYWSSSWSVTVKSSDGKTYRNKATTNGSQKIRIIESQLILDDLKTEIQDTTPEKFDFTRNINVTFYWYIKDPREGKNYNYTLYLEWVKVYIGYWANVYNSNENKYEEHIVGSEMEYTLKLSQYWNWSAVIKWRVKAEDDDGRIYESDAREAAILPKSNVKIILYYPADDTILTQGKISYSWCPIKEGTVYGIFFDKGANPFDRYFETWADVGENTEYTKYMSAGWWSGFDWGVAAQAPDGSIYCSEIRSAKIVKK